MKTVFLILAVLLVGCAHVPAPVESHEPMYDPVSGKADDGIGTPIVVADVLWFPVTTSFQARYVALVKKYASRFTPPIDATAGFRTTNGQLQANGYVMQNLDSFALWERGSEKSQ